MSYCFRTLTSTVDKNYLEVPHSVDNSSLVSSIWHCSVASFTLFSTILRSIKDVVQEEESKEVKKVTKIDPSKVQYTSTRQLPQSVCTPLLSKSSKFSKRFGMTSNDKRVQTPSTTASEIESDENQWIRRPPLSKIYDPNAASDPQALKQSLSEQELGQLQDYTDMWSNNISDLLDKLRDTIPGEGMIGEVHYWRDLARILEAINNEVKQSYVEVTVQVLSCW